MGGGGAREHDEWKGGGGGERHRERTIPRCEAETKSVWWGGPLTLLLDM